MSWRMRVAGVVLFLPATMLFAAQEAADAKYEEVLQKLLGTLKEINKTLTSITDETTAKAAHPELGKQAKEFIETRKKSEALAPPDTEVRERISKKYAPEFEKTRKELVGQVARVKLVPGGTAALQEIRGVFERKP